MNKTIVILIFLLSPAAFAEQESEYTEAKKDLIVIIAQAEKFKALPRSNPVDELDGKARGFLKANGEKLDMTAQESMLYACSRFFSIVDTFSEKELLDKCSEWGWLPKGRRSY